MTHVFDLALLAQAGAGGSKVPGCGGGGLTGLIPMLLMIVVFYFLLIRPQQKKAKLHREMLSNLKRGDEVVTIGGLMGKISGLSDRFVTLEVAEKVRMRVLRSHVQGRQSDQIEEPR